MPRDNNDTLEDVLDRLNGHLVQVIGRKIGLPRTSDEVCRFFGFSGTTYYNLKNSKDLTLEDTYSARSVLLAMRMLDAMPLDSRLRFLKREYKYEGFYIQRESFDLSKWEFTGFHQFTKTDDKVTVEYDNERGAASCRVIPHKSVVVSTELCYDIESLDRYFKAMQKEYRALAKD